MIVRTTVESLEKARLASAIAGSKTGFVPTMGALHHGHIQLLQQSKQQCQQSIVSIFVNPAQFNVPADFEKYPRTTEDDIAQLEAAGCDILFLPHLEEIYAEKEHYPEHYDLGSLDELLEGEYRPGHYQGVCKVMHRLLNIVKPGKLFMGQKDYQQCMVVKKLKHDYNLVGEFVMVPTIREHDGLAMSSRNRRLNQAQRLAATAIYTQMQYIASHLNNKSFRILEQEASEQLIHAGFSAIDYVSIADADTLEPCLEGKKYSKRICLVAAFMGEVRLIDNLFLE